jgi:hypothetical protein
MAAKKSGIRIFGTAGFSRVDWVMLRIQKYFSDCGQPLSFVDEPTDF